MRRKRTVILDRNIPKVLLSLSGNLCGLFTMLNMTKIERDESNNQGMKNLSTGECGRTTNMKDEILL